MIIFLIIRIITQLNNKNNCNSGNFKLKKISGRLSET